MGHTHNRSQRFGGHTKHTFYCSCGRTVSGNGGKQHFKLDGHRRVTWEQSNDRISQIAGKAFEAKSMAEKEGFEPSINDYGLSKRPGPHPCDVDLQRDLEPKRRERA